MTRFLTLFFLLVSPLFGEYSIVFVHIGPKLPEYARVAIAQARLFNKEANVVLLANEVALEDYHAALCEYDTKLISLESLTKTDEHTKYEQNCAHKDPFWRYTSERFLYLWDYIHQYNVENVFHLENDNMLYANLSPLLSTFQENYPGLGITIDNHERCIPGFVWINNPEIMKECAAFFSSFAKSRSNDMFILGKFRKKLSSPLVTTLPIIMKEYAQDFKLVSAINHRTKTPELFYNNSDLFDAIFDAAAIGQFLGGIDPIHNNSKPGFINESCLFNPSKLSYSWKLDKKQRLVPYASYKGKEYKIINLHIHCKDLKKFQS